MLVEGAVGDGGTAKTLKGRSAVKRAIDVCAVVLRNFSLWHCLCNVTVPNGNGEEPLARGEHGWLVHHDVVSDDARLTPHKLLCIGIVANAGIGGVVGRASPGQPESAERIDPKAGIVATIAGTVDGEDGIAHGERFVRAVEQDVIPDLLLDASRIKGQKDVAARRDLDAGDSLPDAVLVGVFFQFLLVGYQHDRHLLFSFIIISPLQNGYNRVAFYCSIWKERCQIEFFLLALKKLKKNR